MMKTVLGLVVSVMLFSGCVRGPQIIPDPRIPHKVAEESDIKVWCRLPDGKLGKCKVRLLEGWWLASPYLVEMPVQE